MARILLVDDEEVSIDSLARVLRMRGHEIDTASNGLKALQAYRSRMSDLVVTDVLMPVKEGISLMRELRSIDPDLPVIVLSGGGRSHNMEFLKIAAHDGATATFQKPCPMPALLQAIEQCLEHRDAAPIPDRPEFPAVVARRDPTGDPA